MRQRSPNDHRNRNWQDAEVIERQNYRKDNYRSTYRNNPESNQVNQVFENRNHNNRNDHGFEYGGSQNQFRNRALSENFNRGDRIHGDCLNGLRVQFDQKDQSQVEMNHPIRIAALRIPQITWSVAKSPRVAEQCDVNIQSINQSADTTCGTSVCTHFIE
ncbi:hypothetical protein TNCV_564131 [Trichonephila clavipes]|nr:hypothetical protein TNCV_564131 [Trichonephila clavipes]